MVVNVDGSVAKVREIHAKEKEKGGELVSYYKRNILGKPQYIGIMVWAS